MTSTTRTPTVAYVTGRRRALARSIAIEAARLQGLVWSDVLASDKNRLIAEAEEVIARWIADGVLVEFLGEYREKV